MSRAKPTNLLEGAKVSKQLIQRALSDPGNTLGFEAEFLLLGGAKWLSEMLIRGLETRDQGGGEFYVKKLGDFTWPDVLLFMTPLGVSVYSTESNQKVMFDRLLDIYEEHAQDADGSETGAQMWNALKNKFRVHEIITMMRTFPQGRIMGVSEEKISTFKDIVYDGDVEEIRPFGKLNSIDIATAEVGYEEEDYSLQTNEATRDAAYDIISKELQGLLGETVVYTTQERAARRVSDGYQVWVLTRDHSLDEEEEKRGAIGCELISPVKQAADGYKALQKVLEIMNGAILKMPIKTTKATGLHINFGVEDGADRIDALKILVLLGDEKMVEKFGRAANEHARSARGEMLKRMIGEPTSVAISTVAVQEVMKILRRVKIDQSDMKRLIDNLNRLLPKSKSYSVRFSNISQGYVEFRAIGNEDYQKRPKEIFDSIHEMMAVTVAATDDEVYRKEFLKKLYKIMINAISELRGSELVAASVGFNSPPGLGGGSYAAPTDIEDYRETPYDGENLIQYGFDPGSQTQ